MLFERQRLLLTLLDAVGEPVGHTDFQKLLHLYTHECESPPSYDFVPYKFGAFSFTSYADKRKLIAEGLLTEDDQNWTLTDAGRAEARRQAVEPLASGAVLPAAFPTARQSADHRAISQASLLRDAE